MGNMQYQMRKACKYYVTSLLPLSKEKGQVVQYCRLNSLHFIISLFFSLSFLNKVPCALIFMVLYFSISPLFSTFSCTTLISLTNSFYLLLLHILIYYKIKLFLFLCTLILLQKGMI